MYVNAMTLRQLCLCRGLAGAGPRSRWRLLHRKMYHRGSVEHTLRIMAHPHPLRAIHEPKKIF